MEKGCKTTEHKDQHNGSPRKTNFNSFTILFSDKMFRFLILERSHKWGFSKSEVANGLLVQGNLEAEVCAQAASR